MKKFFFQKILQKEGWIYNTQISIDSNGKIKDIQKNYLGADYEQMISIAIPGIPNAHSHAFQYAMAGMTENHQLNFPSDFWSWRKNMYDLALNIDPDDLQNIATMLYSEMLSNGYTHVAEFHYLHNDKNGQPYSNIPEMGERILIAAKDAGIDITLVPIFYNQGNFNTKFQKEQRRFINESTESYLELIEKTQRTCDVYKSNLGLGVHSIRAVKDFMIKELNDYNKNKYPFHLHISEQIKEVEDCLNYYNLRPVEWLFSNFEIGENHHLVHATHLNDKEINLIAKKNSNVILCPTTEGNLADGFFKLKEFQYKSGNWCFGSDSHIGLSPFEETRLLDYGLRLQTNSRKTFFDTETANASHLVMKNIFFNGMNAMGIKRKNYFEKGFPLNFIELDEKRPLISSSENDHLLNTLFYTGDCRNIKNTYIKGINTTEKNKNKDFQKKYIQTIKKIKERI